MSYDVALENADGCHCPTCVQAHSAYCREFRLRAARKDAPRDRDPLWRCACDGLRLNNATTCAACGAPAPWLAQQEAP